MFYDNQREEGDERGYGFQGVLMFDGEDDKVQCHLCGEWFEYLPNHLHREHTTSAGEYKEMVGLSQSTALLGERQRAKLIENGLARRLQNLRPGKKRTQKEKDKIRETLKRMTRERQNLTGTCPAQLIERIREAYHRVGHTPQDHEIKGKETIIYVCRQDANNSTNRTKNRHKAENSL